MKYTEITSYVDGFFGYKQSKCPCCVSGVHKKGSYNLIDWFQSRGRMVMALALLVRFIPGINPASRFAIIWASLLILVLPQIQSCFQNKLSKQAFIGMLCSTFIWLLPYSLFIKWTCYLSVLLYSFSIMLQSKQTDEFVSYVITWSVAISALGIFVAKPLFLLAVIPFSWQLIYHNKAAMHGHFSFVLAVALTLVFTLMSNYIGLGHIVCLDEALISCGILQIRSEMNQRSIPANGKWKKGVPILTSGKVINSDPQMRVLLHKCRQDKVLRYLKEGYHQTYLSNGHENAEYLVSDFIDNTVPGGAIFNDDVKQIDFNPLPDEQLGLLHYDHIISKVVPALFLLSLFGALSAYVMGASPAVCASIAIVGSMANCPCVFYIVEIYQWMMGKQSSSASYSVRYNLKSKLSLWPKWSRELSSYIFGFDRTGTTFFKGEGSSDQDVYRVHGDVKAWMNQGWFKDLEDKFFLSAAGAQKEFKQSFMTDAVSLGFSEDNVICNAGFKNSEAKYRHFAIRTDSKKAIYFGDGDNDAKIMEHQDCLGVGVESVSAVSRYASLMVGSPKAFKNMTGLLERLVYAQNQSSFLMTGAVIANTIAVSLPIVMWVARREVIPLWASCAVSTGASCLLLAGSALSTYLSPRMKSEEAQKPACGGCCCHSHAHN